MHVVIVKIGFNYLNYRDNNHYKILCVINLKMQPEIVRIIDISLLFGQDYCW